MTERLASAAGLVVFLGIAWVLSLNRRRFPWRTVLSGLALQTVVALVLLKTTFGLRLFEVVQACFMALLAVSGEGAKMVFGPLAEEAFLKEQWGPGRAFIFVVTVSATIVVVSSLSSLLYHYGILQRLVRGMAWVMQRIMGTSGSESLSAAANIFLGQTEAPLLIKPYLARTTASELMAVMVGGMATIAGGVMAAYVKFGEQAGRMDMAGHLLTASVLNAPAGLLMAKILLPETQASETQSGANAAVERQTVNGLDALCQGAGDGLRLAMNVMAMLIAFVALVKLANWILVWPQSTAGTWLGYAWTPVTLETLFGWFNAPFAWLLGVPASDAIQVGQVLGERLVTNEFVGYVSLTRLESAGLLADRSFILASYALCGFANFSSIAIQIGGIGALVPERRSDLARLGLRAMVGGALACYMSAAIVGLWL